MTYIQTNGGFRFTGYWLSHTKKQIQFSLRVRHKIEQRTMETNYFVLTKSICLFFIYIKNKIISKLLRLCFNSTQSLYNIQNTGLGRLFHPYKHIIYSKGHSSIAQTAFTVCLQNSSLKEKKTQNGNRLVKLVIIGKSITG